MLATAFAPASASPPPWSLRPPPRRARANARVRLPPPRSGSDGGGGDEPTTATPWVSPDWLTSLSRAVGRAGADDSGIPVASAKLDDVQDLLGGALFLPLFKWFREEGPVYRLAAGPRNFVIVSDPAVAKHVLRGYGSRYEKGLVAEVSEFLFGSGFAIAEGALWTVRRRAVVPSLHKRFLSIMVEKVFCKCTERLIEKLEPYALSGEPVNMEARFSQLTLDVIGLSLFNYNFDSLTTDSPVIDAVYTALKEAELRSTDLLPYWKIDFLCKIIPRQIKAENAVKTIRNTVEELIMKCKEIVEAENEQIEGEEYVNEGDPSILRFLLASRDEVSSVQLRDDLLSMLVAGHETTGSVLTWTIYLLSKDPTALRRAQDEVDTVLQGRLPRYEDVKELKYLMRCINESMRLYPHPPVLLRRAIVDDVLPGNYKVKAGQDIMISVYNIHRSPEVWDRADEFIPERFDLEGPVPNESNTDFRFIPFSGGPRKCVGDQFALLEAIVALTIVLQKIDIQLVPDQKINMTTGATIHTTNGLYMNVSLRKVQQEAELALSSGLGAPAIWGPWAAAPPANTAGPGLPVPRRRRRCGGVGFNPTCMQHPHRTPGTRGLARVARCFGKAPPPAGRPRGTDGVHVRSRVRQAATFTAATPALVLIRTAAAPPGMSHQSDTSSCSDDSEDGNAVNPTGIYTMEEFIAEHCILQNLLERISVKIHAKIKARQAGKAGTSRRRTGFRRRVIERDHGEGHQRLVTDFFSEDPVYDAKVFRTRYRMSRPLFLRIVCALGEWSPYFTKRTDICYRQGLSPLQKCTAAIRMLARGCAADAVDEYVQIGTSTAMECLERFAEGVIDKFGGEYLRGPTSADMQHLLKIDEGLGFPGMLGSAGCMHWEWENCPPKWMRRLNHSDHGFATFILEAVASQDLWIWHASFNAVGSISDISVLNQSPLFTQILKGQAPPVQFSINKNQYDMGYYLADEIYPECTVFVKTIPFPRTEKERLFAKHQEEARKDVQRAFAVLQSRFPIVRGPIRFFQRATLGKILQACVILHNMAVQDEKGMASTYSEPNETSGITAVLPSNIKTGPANYLTNVLQRSAPICIQETHGQLRRDLIEHIWHQFGPFGDK